MVKFYKMNEHGQQRIAIVGSRTKNYDDSIRCKEIVKNKIFNKLDRLTDTIISGGAGSGADYWARYWANQLGFRYLEATCFWYKPDGNTKNIAPYDFRNETIALWAHEAYAVWDMKSKGTQNVINHFYNYEVPLEIIRL